MASVICVIWQLCHFRYRTEEQLTSTTQVINFFGEKTVKLVIKRNNIEKYEYNINHDTKCIYSYNLELRRKLKELSISLTQLSCKLL